MKKQKSEFKKFPEWQGVRQGYGQHHYLQSVEAWKRDTVKKLEKARTQLNEILSSELMKQAQRFMPRAKDRWEGQLSVVEELLEALK